MGTDPGAARRRPTRRLSQSLRRPPRPFSREPVGPRRMSQSLPGGAFPREARAALARRLLRGMLPDAWRVPRDGDARGLRTGEAVWSGRRRARP